MTKGFPVSETVVAPAMGDSRHFRAFISYSHSDSRVALRLHRSLEGYRVPKRLRGTPGEFGPVPERLSPIFCDREELASSADLGTRVKDALADSDALIVVCSPQAARSHWVNEEVLSFKRLGGVRRIHCLIVSGEPNAGDERECFPPALRFDIENDGELGQHHSEPIAADLRPGKDGAVRARLKLIAGLLGIGFDTLRQREAQRRHRRMAIIAAASVAGMTLALILATTAWIERNRAQAASRDAQRRQAQAEGLLGFLLDDLRPKLTKVGQLDLLNTVDEKAEHYFSNLDPNDLNDNTLARQAQTLTGIGQVRSSQARYPEALESFQRAYERSSALVDRHPSDGPLLFDRGQAEYWVGFAYWQSRDLDKAQIWWTRYRDTSREVYELDPNNLAWEHELAYGDHNVAVIALEGGQLELAAAAFDQSRTAVESVLAKTPDDAQTMFDVADEVSWQGSTQEQLGNLDRATDLLAEKSERVRVISSKNPNNPKWKAEWSTAQVMQSELLRIRGRNIEAYAVANEAVERMVPLTLLDPGNKDWSQDYVYALLMRAAACASLQKKAEMQRDLAVAQPLLDAIAQADPRERHVRRDLLDAASLRILMALQDNDQQAARTAADGLHGLDGGAASQNSAVDAGRYAMSQVAAGLAARANGLPSDADVYFSTARRMLAPLASRSRYWRVLDPWARLARASGDTVEADRVESQLAGIGYVPLFPWAAKNGANANLLAGHAGNGPIATGSTVSAHRNVGSASPSTNNPPPHQKRR